jgi:hypothetical protein
MLPFGSKSACRSFHALADHRGRACRCLPSKEARPCLPSVPIVPCREVPAVTRCPCAALRCLPCRVLPGLELHCAACRARTGRAIPASPAMTGPAVECHSCRADTNHATTCAACRAIAALHLREMPCLPCHLRTGQDSSSESSHACLAIGNRGILAHRAMPAGASPDKPSSPDQSGRAFHWKKNQTLRLLPYRATQSHNDGPRHACQARS